MTLSDFSLSVLMLLSVSVPLRSSISLNECISARCLQWSFSIPDLLVERVFNHPLERHTSSVSQWGHTLAIAIIHYTINQWRIYQIKLLHKLQFFYILFCLLILIPFFPFHFMNSFPPPTTHSFPQSARIVEDTKLSYLPAKMWNYNCTWSRIKDWCLILNSETAPPAGWWCFCSGPAQ